MEVNCELHVKVVLLLSLLFTPFYLAVQETGRTPRADLESLGELNHNLVFNELK
jgi:hypothetical protein